MKRDKYINTTMNVNGGKSKKKVVITLVVVIFILILLALIATVLLTTGVLENSKDKFFALVEKDFVSEEGLVDNRLKQYYESMETSPYTNQGSLESDIKISNGDEEILSHPGDDGKFGVEFSGKTDKANDIKESDITLNYGKDASWNLKYKKVNGITGIQSDYLTPKYIAAKNEDFESILQQIMNNNENSDDSDNDDNSDSETGNISGVNTNLSEIISKFSNIKIDTATLQSKIDIIKEQLEKDKFSKTENGEYVATLDSQDIINIINVLQLDIGIDTATIAQQNLTMEIIASQTGEINSKINVQVNNEENTGNMVISLKLSKENSADTGLIYTFTIGIEYTSNDTQLLNLTANLTLGYMGLDSMQKVNENHMLTIVGNIGTGTIDWSTEFNNDVTLSNVVDVAEFTDEDALNLSNYPDEQVTPFIGQVKDRVNQINETLFERSGLQEKTTNLAFILIGLFASGMTNSSGDQNIGSDNEPTVSFEPGVTGSIVGVKGEYVKTSSDGTSTNISDKLHETKTFEGLEISDTELTENDGSVTMLATVKNTTEDFTSDQVLKITFLDEEGNQILTIDAMVTGLGPGEEAKLNAGIANNVEGVENVINAYDFTISK